MRFFANNTVDHSPLDPYLWLGTLISLSTFAIACLSSPTPFPTADQAVNTEAGILMMGAVGVGVLSYLTRTPMEILDSINAHCGPAAETDSPGFQV